MSTTPQNQDFHYAIAAISSIAPTLFTIPVLLESIGINSQSSYLMICLAVSLTSYLSARLTKNNILLAPGILYITYMIFSLDVNTPADFAAISLFSALLLIVFALTNLTKQFKAIVPDYFKVSLSIAFGCLLAKTGIELLAIEQSGISHSIYKILLIIILYLAIRYKKPLIIAGAIFAPIAYNIHSNSNLPLINLNIHLIEPHFSSSNFIKAIKLCLVVIIDQLLVINLLEKTMKKSNYPQRMYTWQPAYAQA